MKNATQINIHLYLIFQLLLIVEEFYTQEDVKHPTTHCDRPQVYGVVSLESLVDSSPTSGPNFTAVGVKIVARVVFCLLHYGSILVEVDDDPLTGVIASLITECNQVNPITGGSEHS